MATSQKKDKAMKALDAIEMSVEGKKLTPIEEANAIVFSRGMKELAVSAQNQYAEMMNMLTGYQAMLEQLTIEAERDGFKRYTVMYIFAVMGRPVDYTPPVRNPIIAYMVMDSPYDGEAMATAEARYPDVQGVFLYEVRGQIRDPQHIRHMKDYAPVQYKAWRRTWA